MSAHLSNVNYKGFNCDIHNIAVDMSEGCLTEIKEFFFIEGKFPPIVRWCSLPQNDWPKPHKILANFWRDNSSSDKFNIASMSKDPDAKQIIPFLARFKLTNSEESVRYNGLGTRAAHFLGVPTDYNLDLKDILDETQSAQILFTLTSILACMIRGQGMQILSQDSGAGQNILWNNLIVPIIDSGSGKVKECAMCLLRTPPN